MISRGKPGRSNAGGLSPTPRWATGALFQTLALIAAMALGALLGWIAA